jgi:hypothetical protein
MVALDIGRAYLLMFTKLVSIAVDTTTLDRVIAAVARHRDDDSPGADARLYAEVLGEPVLQDLRVDDPNDWPDP